MTEPNRCRAEETAQKWHFHYVKKLRCVAQSDGGIDCDENYEREMFIPPEMITFEGEKPTGVSFAGHLFLFDDPATHTLTVKDPEESVGGWGDTTITHYYTLTPGPAPEGSFPAVVQS